MRTLIRSPIRHPSPDPSPDPSLIQFASPLVVSDRCNHAYRYNQLAPFASLAPLAPRLYAQTPSPPSLPRLGGCSPSHLVLIHRFDVLSITSSDVVAVAVPIFCFGAQRGDGLFLVSRVGRGETAPRGSAGGE